MGNSYKGILVLESEYSKCSGCSRSNRGWYKTINELNKYGINYTTKVSDTWDEPDLHIEINDIKDAQVVVDILQGGWTLDILESALI
jgi:hypothetical protein